MFAQKSRLFGELLKVLTSSLAILADKPEETPRTCLMALWHKATGVEASAGSAPKKPLRPLTPEAWKSLRKLVEARLSGQPLAYLTGRQQFMGMDFIATPQAVIPRKDTEVLARAVIDWLEKTRMTARVALVVDMFTGSGNVALSLAKRVSGPRYFGSDLSAGAIDLAKRNAKHLQLESACSFLCGDLFAPFKPAEFGGRVDLVCGAPPFISSTKVARMPEEISQHEPPAAFDAGPFGVTLYLRLFADAPRFLKHGGWLFFEVGVGQGEWVVQRLASDCNFCHVRTFADNKGEIHAAAAQRT